METRILKKQEVAKIFRVTPRTIKNWQKKGILVGIKLPGQKNTIGYAEEEITRLIGK